MTIIKAEKLMLIESQDNYKKYFIYFFPKTIKHSDTIVDPLRPSTLNQKERI